MSKGSIKTRPEAFVPQLHSSQKQLNKLEIKGKKFDTHTHTHTHTRTHAHKEREIKRKREKIDKNNNKLIDCLFVLASKSCI